MLEIVEEKIKELHSQTDIDLCQKKFLLAVFFIEKVSWYLEAGEIADAFGEAVGYLEYLEIQSEDFDEDEEPF